MKNYQDLQQALALNSELPVTEDWSAAADFLYLIKDYCLEHRPTTIVECSSGLTSLVLARCCQINACGKVFSLENAAEFVEKTRQNLSDFELHEYANIIFSPLKPFDVEGKCFEWYELDNLNEMQIDMLVIDGPPGYIQKHSRFPALPLLFDRMAKKSIVYLDDAARDEEKQLVEMWLELSDEIEHEYIETERGCSVIRINKV